MRPASSEKLPTVARLIAMTSLTSGDLLAARVDVHTGEHGGKDGHEGHDIAVDTLLDAL